MNIIARLTQKHLWSNKRRTWVTIIGVMLCTSMICAVSTLVGSFRHYMMETEKYQSGTYHASFSALPFRQVPQLKANAEIADAGLTYDKGASQNIKTQNPDKPYLSVKECDSTALALLPVHVKEGRLPQTPNEIALPAHFLESSGYAASIGQTLTLSLGRRSLDGAQLPSDKRYTDGETLASPTAKTYTVVGVIERMGSESYSSASFTAISFLDPASLSPDTAVTAYFQMDHPSNTHDVLPQIAQTLGVAKDNVNYNNMLLAYYGSFKDSNVDSMFFGLCAIVLALIMVGSVSVIYNAFAISATERKKQFGLLSSVGATQKQLRRSVWLEGLTVGAIGIPLGVGLGIAGIAVTLQIVQSLLLDLLSVPGGIELTVYVSPLLTLLAVVIAAVTIALSVYIPAKRASKTSPIEAIRTTQDIKTSGKVHANRLTQKLFGFEANLARKQLQRNRKRYRTTIFSLFISLVMFLSFSSFVHYMNTGARMEFQDVGFDYSISASDNEQSADLLQETYRQIKANPSVQQTGLRYGTYLTMKMDYDLFSRDLQNEFTREDATYQPISHDPALGYDTFVLSLAAMPDDEYNALLQENGLSSPDHSGLVLVNEFQYQDDKGVKHKFNGINAGALPRDIEVSRQVEVPGSRMVDQDGNEDYKTETVMAAAPVIGVIQTAPFGVRSPSTEAVAVCSASEFERLRGALRITAEDEPVSPTVYVTVGEQYQAFDAWMDQHPALGNNNSGLHVYSIREMVEENQRVLLIVSIFCYGFITLMMLISVTSVLNTISTNMQLRKKEFAMLQSVGMTRKAMGRMIRFESLFYGLKALLYALPVSVGISYFMYRLFAQNYAFAFTLPWMQYLGAILGVFVLVFATMWYATQKMRKQNIVETIRQDSI